MLEGKRPFDYYQPQWGYARPRRYKPQPSQDYGLGPNAKTDMVILIGLTFPRLILISVALSFPKGL